MKNTIILSSLTVITLSIILWHLFWSNFTPEIFSSIGQFYAGTIGILITLVFAVIAFITYKKQVEYSQHQSEFVQKQNIENVFFKLFDMYESNIKSMEITPKYATREVSFHGRKVFKELYNLLKIQYFRFSMEGLNFNDITQPLDLNKKEKVLNVIQKAYKEFDNNFQADIGFYFRNLYYTINYIDEQKILSNQEKLFYINMLRGQITSYELLLLFYNCLSEKGYSKFKPLIEKYGFLKHIVIIKDKLIDQSNTDHTVLYEKSAYDIK